MLTALYEQTDYSVQSVSKTEDMWDKRIVLVLLWTYVSFTVYFISDVITKVYTDVSLPYIVITAFSLPVAGLASDICLGRYRIIRCSLWTMWLSLVVLSACISVNMYVTVESQVYKIAVKIVGGFLVLGMSGISANVLQFGVDQLTDASSSDISSYINWYFWVFSLAGTIATYTQYCFCGDYFNPATSFFLLPLLCTVSIVCDIFFNKWLVKEPIAKNPFILIYHVLKYAIQNKHPNLRSAFTYWEDKPYSRIDIGKAKYGGPFTTEQVENVKTFFRLVAIIITGIPLAVLMLSLFVKFNILEVVGCRDGFGAQYMARCYKEIAVQHSSMTIITISIPILEFGILPLLHKCSCYYRVKIMHKLMCGIFLLLFSELLCLGREITDYYTLNNSTMSSPCFLDSPQVDVHNGFFWWNFTSYPLEAIALYLWGKSWIELMCAQSPYAMRGLLIGILLLSGATCSGLSTGALELVIMFSSPDTMCGIWFHTTIIILILVAVFIQLTVMKCYVLRKRDILNNEQMFAENYFEKYLSITSTI